VVDARESSAGRLGKKEGQTGVRGVSLVVIRRRFYHASQCVGRRHSQHTLRHPSDDGPLQPGRLRGAMMKI